MKGNELCNKGKFVRRQVKCGEQNESLKSYNFDNIQS